MLYDLSSIPQINPSAIKDKKVLIRVDWNVPIRDGVVLDTTRITKVIPTLTFLKKYAKQIIIICHQGRPEGKIDPKYSLSFLTAIVEKFMDTKIYFESDWYTKHPKDLENVGQFVLFENLRFYPGEENNDLAFAKKLASFADVYVNEGFAVSHRAHASLEAITHLLPSYAGPLFYEELESLSHAILAPSKPVTAVVGGSKISTKLEILENLLHKVDCLILGGGIANTFLLAQGHSVGQSLVENNYVLKAKEILSQSTGLGCRIVLPLDVQVSTSLDHDKDIRTIAVSEIQENDCIFDVGPATVELFREIVETSKTFIWNGPLGVFEVPPYNKGSLELAHLVGTYSRTGKLFSVVGGGETLAVVTLAGVQDDISFLSTAGGAFLEFLEGKMLPGVQALLVAGSAKKQGGH